MAKYIYLKCLDCSEDIEVYCDGDNAMMCPECRSVDNFEEIEEETTIYTYRNSKGERLDYTTSKYKEIDNE